MRFQRRTGILSVFCLTFALTGSATAQNAAAPTPAPPPQTTTAVPEAPQPQVAAQRSVAPDPPVPWLIKHLRASGKPLTTEQKFTQYLDQAFGPPAFITPAFSAGIRMARPTSGYPREWKDGPEAFGRLYGDSLVTHVSRHTAEFLTAAAFHYDDRYSPSKSTEALPRIAHALAFVVVEKTDSGTTAFALPHFAGAAAGGFTGMAYLPPGYDDLTHAGQRASIELAQIAIRNMAGEFAPELVQFSRKLHLDKVIPPRWTPEHRTHPSQP